MDLPLKKHGKYTILRAGKNLTLCAEEHKMRDALEWLMETNSQNICVDLSDAVVIDSSVIGTIVEFHKKALDNGGEVVIMNPHSIVLEALVHTQINRVIRFVENESQL